MGKESEKLYTHTHTHTHIMKSLCYMSETNTTLKINYTSIKKRMNRMGNTCKSMADSCQCMTKTTTIL